MCLKNFLRKQAALLWKFLGFFQPPEIRRVHAAVMVLVILQICSSAGMSMSGLLGDSIAPVAGVFDWYHILEGLGTALLAVYMTILCFSQRGLRRFYPYLWGDTARIKKDLLDSLRGIIPAPQAGGLATAVQGLGFGALLLTVLSGTLWFVLWTSGASAGSTAFALQAHKSIVTLLVLYLFGHGGMALLHFVLWQRKTKQAL